MKKKFVKTLKKIKVIKKILGKLQATKKVCGVKQKFVIFLKTKVFVNPNADTRTADLLRYINHRNKKIKGYYIDTDVVVYAENKIIENIPYNYERILSEGSEHLIDTYFLKDFSLSRRALGEILLKERERFYGGDVPDSITCLYDALQEILFWNQILWQTGHRLNGLGRLDKILYPYYKDDENGFALIKEFCKTLDCFYNFKSNSLLGDTGQVIVLGGMNEKGEYEVNELTYMFIQAIKELRLPDPKILLRVSEKMPDDLLELAIECIASGVGSPLLSNDDVVIPCIKQFGYEHADAVNYAVSACWEPLIPGKSLEQNNMADIAFPIPLINLITCEKEFESFDDFLKMYKEYLIQYVQEILSGINSVKWEKDSILSMVMYDCERKTLDISKGGARYNNYGLLSVGMANAINSLINIKKYVFEEKVFDLSDISKAIKSNYVSNHDLYSVFSSEKKYFGVDSEEYVLLTNEIMGVVDNRLKDFRNEFGGRVKIGYSSPNYLVMGQKIRATCDGRLNGQPLSTHISNDELSAYTELINFASDLNYSECKSNGNVVDIMIHSNFLHNNMDAFLSFVKASIRKGVFQLQFNVVSVHDMIDAQLHPEKYKGLIVRVWGFSAYFVDLPKEYQDMLIKRAKDGERTVAC